LQASVERMVGSVYLMLTKGDGKKRRFADLPQKCHKLS